MGGNHFTFINLTCMKTFILSRGAVPVRETAPATAPATRCFHQRPELFSSSVNSSGMARLSPMSSTWGQHVQALIMENNGSSRVSLNEQNGCCNMFSNSTSACGAHFNRDAVKLFLSWQSKSTLEWRKLSWNGGGAGIVYCNQ